MNAVRQIVVATNCKLTRLTLIHMNSCTHRRCGIKSRHKWYKCYELQGTLRATYDFACAIKFFETCSSLFHLSLTFAVMSRTPG